MELTTWKAVAAHLGVHIRTVQAWERDRSFPITRLPGGRGRVSTTTERIEEWKNGATPPLPDNIPSYRWPLGQGITAEVRFHGTPLTSAHLEVLRQYLDIAKNALATHHE